MRYSEVISQPIRPLSQSATQVSEDLIMLEPISTSGIYLPPVFQDVVINSAKYGSLECA